MSIENPSLFANSKTSVTEDDEGAYYLATAANLAHACLPESLIVDHFYHFCRKFLGITGVESAGRCFD